MVRHRFLVLGLRCGVVWCEGLDECANAELGNVLFALRCSASFFGKLFTGIARS